MRTNFIKAIDLIHSAKENGIKVILNDNELKLSFAQNIVVDKVLIEEIKGNKQVIIDYLSNKNWKFSKVLKNHQSITVRDKNYSHDIPLSFSQQRLWFIHQLEGTAQYHLPTVLKLTGNLNIEALSYAFQQIVNRHEVLRSVIIEKNGENFQHVKKENGWVLNIENSILDESALNDKIAELITKPFNLTKDYMLRADLLKTGFDQHVLVVTLHHISSDAWSISIIVKEVVALYNAFENNHTATLSSLPIQYADYAIWQRNYLQGDLLQTKLQYWKNKLSDINPLQLPFSYPRPVVQSTKGAVVYFNIDQHLNDKLEQLSLQQGATLFMTLLTVFKVLMFRYSGQHDICVGTPIAGRQHLQVESLIGFFINTLALRSNLNNNPSFIELLKQVKFTTLEAYDHQDIPFEKLVESIVTERDKSRTPLFQVMFILQNTPQIPALQLGNVSLSRQPFNHTTAKFELTFNITQTSNGLLGCVEYCTDLFSLETINAMVVHFKKLIESVVNNPIQKIGLLHILSSVEEAQILNQFNNNSNAYAPVKSVVDLFQNQVSKKPESIALIFEDKQLTYQQLNERANQLAHYLKKFGVKEQTIVPICIARRMDMVIAIWAILKCGAAYLPIDPDCPPDRFNFLMNDAGATHLVTCQQNASQPSLINNVQIIDLQNDLSIINGESIQNLNTDISFNDLAYIIYTSGSTGKPKGVMINHSNLLSYLQNGKTNYISEEAESSGSFIHLSYTFDAAVSAIFMPLLAGKKIVIASQNSTDIFEDINLQKYAPYDFIKITPAHLELIAIKIKLENGGFLTKKLVIGGDALLKNQLNLFVENEIDITIVNEYGPTEATVGCSVFSFNTLETSINYANHIPIGKPIDHTKIYIVSESNQLVPIGVTGELCIAGPGVSSGYLNQPNLTAQKFIPCPFYHNDEAKMYKTGDLAKWLPNGDIIYLGRKDAQVKIRGYRIELGEIEMVLQACQLVNQAVVLVNENDKNNKFLLAYVVAENVFNKEDLISYLQKFLPEYMIPIQWVHLQSMPLTVHGKIDKNKLLQIEFAQIITTPHVEPRNAAETKLVIIWQRLLQLNKVGTHDNFFNLGGHSILAMRLVAAIRKELKVELSIKNLFTYSTIALLAAHLKTQTNVLLMPAIQAHKAFGKIPLSFSQERLWFIHELEGSVQYHLPIILRLDGYLNIEALSATLQQIVNRHQTLRTVINETDGESYQHIKNIADWQLNITNETIDAATLNLHIQNLINQPFNLSKDYMLRANLLKESETNHLLVVTIHHIASDAWSLSLIVKEVVELYNAFAEGREIVLPPLPIQYADFAIWQRNYLQGEVLQTKLSYWKDKLNGVATLQLPTDFKRPATQSNRGATTTFFIDAELKKQLHLLTQQQATTIFITLLAIFKVLLYRYTGEQDVCIGTPIAGRQQQEQEGLVGFFINSLVLRDCVNGKHSFNELLQQVKITTLEAYENQEIPYEKVVEASVSERDVSRNPLFQILFALHNTPDIPELKLGNLKIALQKNSHTTSKLDLSFNITEKPEGLHGVVEYCTDLFKEETVQQMILHYVALVKSVAANSQQRISALTMFSVDEEKKLLINFNDTDKKFTPNKTIIQLFETQVGLHTTKTALIFNDELITFGELNTRINKLANYLVGMGVGAEKLVPVCLQPSINMFIAIFAILKAGGAYVPVDPDFPLDRIAFIFKDINATLVISDIEKLNEIEGESNLQIINPNKDWDKINAQSGENINTVILPAQLAYIIYTSGSTGRPKGVMIEHGSMLSYLINEKTNYTSKITTNTTGSFVHLSYTFDASLSAMYMPLLVGKTVVIGSKKSVDVFTDVNFAKYAPYDFIKITPAHLSLLQPNMKMSNGELVTNKLVIGGEPLFKGQFDYLLQEGIDIEIINEYGPTEATVGCTTYSFDVCKNATTISNTIPIGKHINNVSMYILGHDNELMPIGSVGQLCIGGAGVARGYLNRLDLTKEKFIDNPFSNIATGKIYKTGDLAKWLPDGNIEYLSRIDDQVKIRGYRIEPSEIESVLNACEMVDQAAVIVNKDSQGNNKLIAYLVLKGDFKSVEIIAYLKEKLPDFMLPALLIPIINLPLTSNGKVNRKLLPLPHLSNLSGTEYVAPNNTTEAQLVDIWKQILQLERVGTYDNFFSIGGHSLLAMRLISAVRKAFQIEIAVAEIFNSPTVFLMALQINKHSNQILLPSIEAYPKPNLIPLSFSQERLWFIDQLEGSTQYHLPTVLRIKGNINIAALTFALQQIINRHEILRTVIREKDGEGYQHIKDKDQWQLTRTPNPFLKNDSISLQNFIKNIVNKPFDLSVDYMLKAELISVHESESLLVVTLHHIASDGWSTSIIVSELVECYNAFNENRLYHLPVLKIQYRDYAIWQRNYLRDELLETKLNYWKKQLQGVNALQLPVDYARPVLQSTKGATAGFKLNKQLTDQLKLIGEQAGTTMFMTLLSLFKILLFRYSGQQDICVGTPTAGRHQIELEGLIGFFINTLALRTNVSPNASFTSLLKQVRTTTLEAFDHQDVPFEKVVDALSIGRDMSKSPLFQVMFIMQNTPKTTELKLGNVELVKEPFSSTSAKFDISFYVSESQDGIQGVMEYCTDLFSTETMEMMLVHFQQLIKAVIQNPAQKIGQLPMLTMQEKHELLVDFNDTEITWNVDKTVINLFEEQAQKSPDIIAIIFELEQITFRQLNERANKLAQLLISKNISQSSLVPICINRSIEMFIGIIAILKTGAAYVPIDINHPEDRIKLMLQEVGSALIVSNSICIDYLILDDSIEVICVDDQHVYNDFPAENFKRKLTFANPLFAIIYTSGSSGKPKGVKLANAGIVNRMHWMWNAFPFEKNEVCALQTSIGFVDHIWELFGPLLKGVSTVLFTKNNLLDTDVLVKKLADYKITRWVLVPSLLKVLLEKLHEENIVLHHLKYWTCSGELLHSDLIENFYTVFPAHSHKLFNIYGSSEVTADVTCFDTSINFINQLLNKNDHLIHSDKSDQLPGIPNSYNSIIGKPIANSTIYIVDSFGQLVPKGVAGEILVGGVQLAKGYLNHPELTEQKFINNKFSTGNQHLKLYKTGDLGCWLKGGNIAYLGRKDDQIKIRGYRIELGEIQWVLKQSNLIKEAVIVAIDDVAGNKKLAGYIVPKNNFNKDALLVYLKKMLPDYMIPALWVTLESLPLTYNGKLDKKALPEITGNQLLHNVFTAPGNELEKKLTVIWQNILHVSQVGIHDNFFEIGGHSILAIRLVAIIRKQLQIQPSINDVFIYPTIACFAKNIIDKAKNPLLPIVNIKHLIAIKPTGTNIPLYIICGAGGTALRFKKFAGMMDENQPVYVLQPPIACDQHLFPNSIEDIARTFIEEILIQNPEGPYALSGHCLGGFIAFEMAKQLEASGKKIHLLALFDSIIKQKEKFDLPSINNLYNSINHVKSILSKLLLKFDFETFLLRKHFRQAISYKMASITRIYNKRYKKTPVDQLEFVGLEVFSEATDVYIKAANNYKIEPYNGEIVLFYAKDHYYFLDRNKNVGFRKLDLNNTTKNLWKQYAGAIKVHDVIGEHSTIFDVENGNDFAQLLQKYINK